MSLSTWTDLVDLVAIIGFILALKGLSSPKGARRGNLIGAAAAVLAIGMAFTNPSLRHEGFGDISNHHLNVILIVVAMLIGTAIAVPVARLVKMTAMPQMVAIFNGGGGGAAALVSITELLKFPSSVAVYKIGEVVLGVIIGSVSFSGSAIAFAKLQEIMSGRPLTYAGQQAVNAILGGAIVGLGIAALATGHIVFVYILLLVSLVLGAALVLPIGGADVPVLISLLNSFTGIAVAASGFTLDNNLLIVAGTLVGASGMLLTRLMSSAMGRSIPNPLLRAARSAQALQKTSACCSHIRGKWPSFPATALRSPRHSTS
jgi:NAD(P) transhydrogenase subunit beta